jgi:hypothetical protein
MHYIVVHEERVYSWRVSPDLKTGLEREARRRKISFAAVLDLAARDWLNKGGAELDGEAEQLRLRKAAAQCIGTLAGGDPHRSETARQAVRERLRFRHGR